MLPHGYIAVKHFDPNADFKAPRSAHPNLNKIAALMVGRNAISPRNAMDLRTLSEHTGIHRSNLTNLIKSRPGFIFVQPNYGGVARYYYDTTFWDEANRLGLNHAYPHMLDGLKEQTLAAIRESTKNEVTSEPAVFNVPAPADRTSGKFAHIEVQAPFLSGELTRSRAYTAIETMQDAMVNMLESEDHTGLINAGAIITQAAWWLLSNPDE